MNKVTFSNAKNEVDSQAGAAWGKRNLSLSSSGRESSHGPDKKIMRGEKPKDSCWYSEIGYPCGQHGASEGDQGRSTPHPVDAQQGVRIKMRTTSLGEHPRDRSSSSSCGPDQNNSWECSKCKNLNFIRSYKCIKCNLPHKLNNLGPKLHKK